MRGSVRIATVGGIPIKIHWSFGILVALVALSYQGARSSALLGAAAWLVVLFGSVIVHELAHSWVARRRGIEVRDIVLLPIGGMSEIADISRSASDEFWIAIVGPLTSLGLSAALAVVALCLRDRLWPPTLMGGPFVVRVVWMNLILAGFNLLPALPLDGGRVLRATLWMRRGEKAATQAAASAGRAIGCVLILVGLFYDLWLAVIGLFVVMGASSEARLFEVRSALEGFTVADVMVPVHPQAYVPAADLTAAPPLTPSDPLYPTALEALGRSRTHAVPVVRDETVVGLVREPDIEALVRRRTVRAG